MYNNGLQNPDLQKLHKKLKLNLNMFLPDILDSTLFKVEEKGDYYYIYPLFYCDRIMTDGDAFIKDTYLIVCPNTYEQIFLFISDNTIVINKTYTLSNIEGNYWIIFIYDEWTFQPLRNTTFTVEYEEETRQYITDNLGYCVFEALDNDFEVVL